MKKKFWLSILVLIISFGFLIFSLERTGHLYRLPKIGSYLLGVKVGFIARQYPPESSDYQRLQAMSEALKKGEKNYRYKINGPMEPVPK